MSKTKTNLNDSGVTPVGRCCIIKLRPEEDKIGSIMLPQGAVEKSQYAGVHATLLAVGGDAFTWSDGEMWGGDVPNAGDKIMIKQYGGDMIDARQDMLHRIIVDSDIVGIGWMGD